MHLFELQFYLGVCLLVELLNHMDQTKFLFLGFWENSTLSSIVAALTHIPTNSVRGFPFISFLSYRTNKDSSRKFSWNNEIRYHWIVPDLRGKHLSSQNYLKLAVLLFCLVFRCSFSKLEKLVSFYSLWKFSLWVDFVFLRCFFCVCSTIIRWYIW